MFLIQKQFLRRNLFSLLPYYWCKNQKHFQFSTDFNRLTFQLKEGSCSKTINNYTSVVRRRRYESMHLHPQRYATEWCFHSAGGRFQRYAALSKPFQNFSLHCITLLFHTHFVFHPYFSQKALSHYRNRFPYLFFVRPI